MKRLSAVAACLFLGACATAEITTPPVMIKPNDPAAAVGIDVYARDRSRGNPVPRFRGQDTVQIRTFGDTGSGNGEIAGAACTLDSGLYKASFNTPANVSVPDYGPNSPAIFVRCLGTQDRSGSVTMQTVNQTNAGRNASAAGAGLLGAIVIGAVNASRMDPETDDFGYNPISVQLK